MILLKYIKQSDQSKWANAKTVKDLGKLTADWIEGKIKFQPGYFGESDLDDAPLLKKSLVKLNKMGFVTNVSQEGIDAIVTPRGKEEHWRQCAFVEGIAEYPTINRIVPYIRYYNYDYKMLRIGATARVPLSWHKKVNGKKWKEHLWGGGSSFEEIEDIYSNDINNQLMDRIFDQSYDFLIWDPVPGRNTIWSDLNKVKLCLNNSLNVPWAISPVQSRTQIKNFTSIWVLGNQTCILQNLSITIASL